MVKLQEKLIDNSHKAVISEGDEWHTVEVKRMTAYGGWKDIDVTYYGGIDLALEDYDGIETADDLIWAEEAYQAVSRRQRENG